MGGEPSLDGVSIRELIPARLSSALRPDLPLVQELPAHTWVTTTQRYTHLEVEDLQEYVARLPANRVAL